jgi:hypothetical protein
MSVGVWMIEYLPVVGYLYVRVYTDINGRSERNVSASKQRALFPNSMNIRVMKPAVRPRIHKDGLLARCCARRPAIPTDHDSFRLREITTAACQTEQWWVAVCFSTGWSNEGGWQSTSLTSKHSSNWVHIFVTHKWKRSIATWRPKVEIPMSE